MLTLIPLSISILIFILNEKQIMSYTIIIYSIIINILIHFNSYINNENLIIILISVIIIIFID